MLGRQLKTAALALLLSATSFGFGAVCHRLGMAYRLFKPPFHELGQLLLLLLAALLCIAAAAGLVSVLLRPWRLASVAFILSGLALLLGWGLQWRNAVLSLLYVLAGLAYTIWTQDELEQRVNFSVQPVAGNWRWVTLVLILLAVCSFYFGFADHVRDKGLSTPEEAVNELTGDVAAEIVDSTPLSRLDVLRQGAVEQVQRVLVGRVRALINRVERYVPPVVAVILFLLLAVLTGLLWWVPMPILWALFALLVALHVAEMATETLEVKRLVLS